ncbi:putative protein OS=Bosea thiooxidans OX=53254 GN=SAMN05660750_00074 PE=4 SV=1 [Bosea thiooxidans]|uniref:Uncharacterized protein n=1 Tax=Bosea thiooxidans TaxID=53254 RepID=A0A1T5ACD1_9HYPH|nr:hypothetical protein [Bosea thiooxidans]SKB32566.1 hypothetical protein SAMN05660750_00074 [Bosea thiooxidans]
MLRPIWPLSAAAAAALILACIAGADPVSAQDDTLEPFAIQLPIPRAALLDPDADEAAAAEATVSGADAVIFNPALAAIGRASAASGAHLRARAPIPVDIIRNGFAARQDTMSAAQDRSVGFKLGKDVFSLSTTLSAPASAGATRDAQISWRLAQPISSGRGFIWGLATGGGSSLYGNPEHTGEALIGYRHELIPHLTLTSQLAMAGNYVFAPGDGLHSALTPEMKLSVDLAKLADLPWQTSFDLALARKLPLVASDFETQGRAMLSFKYKLR